MQLKRRLSRLNGRPRALAWKELVDLARDKKTLATSIMLPLIVFPLLGFISLALISTQEVTIAIVDLDNTSYTNPVLNITVSSSELVDLLKSHLEAKGYNVLLAKNLSAVNDTSIDVIVVIPPGYSRNASSLLYKAKVVIYKRAGIQAASRAESDILGIVYGYSNILAERKTEALIDYSRLNATVEAILYPLKPRTILISVGGKQVGIEYELRNLLARMLVIALSVVVTPATSFIIDGIIGERERKTIEMLLSTPLSVSSIIYIKLMAASMLGLLTALADALGFIAYMSFMSMAITGNPLAIPIDYGLLGLHAIVAFFTILVTVSIALPFITRTRGIRSAANIASIIAIAGTIMFFTGFMVDYTRLPQDIINPLYIIPYTHSILAIQYYVLGYKTQAILHTSILAIASITIIILSTKTLTTEKVLIAPQT
ncbi:ABC transporter permease [Desulfurococcaceae archaeon MEX13E-LK6-19]|nr:ABC transporter permease [Desulfurococcaceae archaeon MEX13E-LK6-19]